MLRRRDVIVGGGMAAAVAVACRFLGGDAMPAVRVAGLIPTDRDSLILHDGSRGAMAWVRTARGEAPNRRVGDQVVAVLAPRGFARTGALLDRARGRAVFALLDDADALVVETLLQARNAQALTRVRNAGQTLLTARI